LDDGDKDEEVADGLHEEDRFTYPNKEDDKTN
jgi:hypothetical protein